MLVVRAPATILPAPALLPALVLAGCAATVGPELAPGPQAGAPAVEVRPTVAARRPAQGGNTGPVEGVAAAGLPPGPAAGGSAGPVEASLAPTTGMAARDFVKNIPANPAGEAADGLVRSREWVVQTWANPADVSAWKRTRTSDDVVLVVELKGGKQDKTALTHKVGMSLAPTGTVRLDVYNPTSREIQIAFAVYASVDQVYSESAPRPVRTGWNRVVFDLAARTYKSAASNWQQKAALWGREDVRELALIFYDKGAATLAIDSIAISSASQP